MRPLTAFLKKEWMEQVRTGRVLIIGLIFILYGILSPALTKLTPWLYESLAESMESQGIIITDITVNALMSWQQFHKNITLMILVFVILYGGILTAEYQKGTLVPVLTKGLPRWTVLAAKGLITVFLFGACYWSAFTITYAYNAYFWDNRTAGHPGAAAACVWLLGIWLLSLIFLGSALFENSGTVLLFTGGVFLLCYLAGLYPGLSGYLPPRLLSASGFLTGDIALKEMTAPALVTAATSVLFFAAAIPVFNRKKI